MSLIFVGKIASTLLIREEDRHPNTSVVTRHFLNNRLCFFGR